MRTILSAGIALSLLAAAIVAIPAPTMADGWYDTSKRPDLWRY